MTCRGADAASQSDRLAGRCRSRREYDSRCELTGQLTVAQPKIEGGHDRTVACLRTGPELRCRLGQQWPTGCSGEIDERLPTRREVGGAGDDHAPLVPAHEVGDLAHEAGRRRCWHGGRDRQRLTGRNVRYPGRVDQRFSERKVDMDRTGRVAARFENRAGRELCPHR